MIKLMDRSFRNLFLNIFGKGIVVLCSILFTPYFIRLLGIEFYGFISFSVSLITIFGLLDFGLNLLVIKEITSRQALKASKEEIINFIRNFESVYWIAGLFFSSILFIFATFIAYHWVKPTVIDRGVISFCLHLLAVTFFFQWPQVFYGSVLSSVHRQGAVNLLLIFIALLRNFGLLGIFQLFEPNIKVFYAWNLVVTIIQTIMFIYLVGQNFRYGKMDFKIDFPHLKHSKDTVFIMAGLSFFAILMSQMDKIVLSRIFNLEVYGYYCLAYSIAGGLPIIAGSFVQTYFPKFSELAALKEEKSLSENYNSATQTLVLLIIPLGLFIAFYSEELIMWWTKSPEMAAVVGPTLAILTVGVMLNSLVAISYMMHLCKGFVKFIFFQNLIATAISMVLIPFFANHYGLKGAAVGVIILNGGYLLINVHFLHRKMLKNQKTRWYVMNILPALFLIAALSLAKKYLHFQSLHYILAVLALCLALSFFCLNFQKWILKRVPLR